MFVRFEPLSNKKVVQENCHKEEKSRSSGIRSIISQKLAQAVFHLRKHQVPYKEELLFRFSEEYTKWKAV